MLSGDGLLKESIGSLDSLDEELFVGTVSEDLIHRFLEKHSSDLASLSGVVLLNERIDMISEELLLISF